MGKKIMGGLFELPSTPDNYYNLHDPEKSFESILFRDGYVLQGRELNDLQELFLNMPGALATPCLPTATLFADFRGRLHRAGHCAGRGHLSGGQGARGSPGQFRDTHVRHGDGGHPSGAYRHQRE